MHIKPYVSGLETSFIVSAENDSDRAILTAFCRSSRWQTHEFRVGGVTFRDGATTDFNFGWVDKKTMAKPVPWWRRFSRSYQKYLFAPARLKP